MRRSRTRNGHSSGTAVAGRLVQPTRARSRDGPAAALASAACAPIRSCSRWGLPCRACYHPRGALLPHRFTLAVRHAGGGLLSVALSLGLPPPDVIRHRVSMEPGLSSACCGGHPADWPSGHRDFDPDRQSVCGALGSIACPGARILALVRSLDIAECPLCDIGHIRRHGTEHALNSSK